MTTGEDGQAQAKPGEEYGYILAASDHNRGEDRRESVTASTNGVSTKEAPTLPSREELEKRKADMFPGLYLTLTSIIQGVAFGFAITTTNTVLSQNPSPSSHAIIWLQALVTIVGIIIVTHKYIHTAAMLRWNPTSLDTLIPYLIGLGEISAALMIGHQASWWFAISFWLLTAICAQGHTLSRTKTHNPEYMTEDYHNFRRSVKNQMICGTVLLIASMAVGLLDFYQRGWRWLNIALLGGAIAGAIAISLIGTAAQRKADDEAGVARWHIPNPFRKRSPRSPDATNATAQPRNSA
jgi:hypothetical protein